MFGHMNLLEQVVVVARRKRLAETPSMHISRGFVSSKVVRRPLREVDTPARARDGGGRGVSQSLGGRAEAVGLVAEPGAKCAGVPVCPGAGRHYSGGPPGEFLLERSRNSVGARTV